MVTNIQLPSRPSSGGSDWVAGAAILPGRADLTPARFLALLPHLTHAQQRVLALLMQGRGVRETARQLGVSHPAIIKHRRKIARVAERVFGPPPSVASPEPGGQG